VATSALPQMIPLSLSLFLSFSLFHSLADGLLYVALISAGLASHNLWHFSVLNALIYVKYDTGHNMQKHFNQLIICTALEATHSKQNPAKSRHRRRCCCCWCCCCSSCSVCVLLHVNNFKSCSCDMWHLNNTAGGCTDFSDMWLQPCQEHTMLTNNDREWIHEKSS